MKKVLKIIVSILFVLVLIPGVFPGMIFLLGSSVGHEPELHQSVENVTDVHLLYSPWDENKVLYILQAEEIPGFMDALLKLKLYKNSSPQGEGGTFYVKVCYADGSYETLGSSSCAYVSSGILEHDGWRCLRLEDLQALFSQYVDLRSYGVSQSEGSAVFPTGDTAFVHLQHYRNCFVGDTQNFIYSPELEKKFATIFPFW